MTVVFYPEGSDPRPMFQEVEKTEEIRYIPVDAQGRVLESVTIWAGDTFYIAGEAALKQPFSIINGGKKDGSS